MSEKNNQTKRKAIKKGIKVVRIVRSVIMDAFEEIDDFNGFMKSAIRREKKIVSERINERASQLNEKELEGYLDYFVEGYQKIDSVFEKLALDSFVVMLYSRVESGMISLCRALRQDKQRETGKPINLSYSDLRANGYLDQAKLYMEKVLGIDLCLGTNPQWPEIVALGRLRNAIVHERGQLCTNDAILKKHIKRGLLELRNQQEGNNEISGRLKVRSEYIDHILPQVQTFFRNIKT